MNAPHSNHPYPPGGPYPQGRGAYPPNGPSPYGYPPTPYGAPPPRARMSPWIWILLGGILLGLGTCGGIVGLVVMKGAAESAEGAVQMGSQLSDSTQRKLRDRKLLNEDEHLVAYYDATLSLDMSEVTVLTTDRITYAKDSRATTIALKDIASIEQRVDTIIGDVIEIRSRRGDRLRIEIAPLNGGVSFLDALEDETREVQPDVVVRRQTPR